MKTRSTTASVGIISSPHPKSRESFADSCSSRESAVAPDGILRHSMRGDSCPRATIMVFDHPSMLGGHIATERCLQRSELPIPQEREPR